MAEDKTKAPENQDVNKQAAEVLFSLEKLTKEAIEAPKKLEEYKTIIKEEFETLKNLVEGKNASFDNMEEKLKSLETNFNALHEQVKAKTNEGQKSKGKASRIMLAKKASELVNDVKASGGQMTVLEMMQNGIPVKETQKCFVDLGVNAKELQTYFSSEKASSITSNYTGDTFLSWLDNRAPVMPTIDPFTLLDVMTIEPLDGKDTMVFQRVQKFVTNVAALGENEALPEFDFNISEDSAKIVRAGAKAKISTNLATSAERAVNEVLKQAPNSLRRIVDNQILFGRGKTTYNEFDGIYTSASVPTFDVADLSYSAGQITAYAEYPAGDFSWIKVTFGADHNLDYARKITLASTVALDGTYNFTVLDAKNILVMATYAAGETPTNWTATAASTFKASVSNSNVIDVVKTMLRYNTVRERRANAIVLNPARLHDMTIQKDTTDQPLRYNDVVINGDRVTISGVPVVWNSRMPYDKVLLGNFDEGLVLGMYENTMMMIFNETSSHDLFDVSQMVFAFKQQMALGHRDAEEFLKGDIATIKAAIDI